MPTREEMNSLAREIISSHQSRVEGVSQIRQETQAQLQGLDRAHNAMAQELRAELGKVKPALDQAGAARKREEAQRAKELAQGVAQRKVGVKAQLQGLGRAHQAMAQRQRTALNQGRATLARDVAVLRKGYRDEQAGARAAWQQLGATMPATRGGAVAVPAAPAPAPAPVVVVAPPPPAVIEAPPEQEAVATVEIGELTPELAALRDRVFAYVADHPDGVRLVEIEGTFKLNRLESSRVVRSLIEEGKAKREDRLYFAL